MNCSRCSSTVWPQASTCATCGAMAPAASGVVTEQPQPAPWPPPAPPRPGSRLTQWLIGLLALGAVTDLVGALTGLRYLGAIGDLLDPAGSITEQQVLEVESLYGTVGAVQLAIYVPCALLFLVWFSRIDGTLRATGAELRHSHGWAVGSWLVPFLNLVRPKQMVDDAWRAADPDRPVGVGMRFSPAIPAWLHLWWALWLLTNALAWAGFRMPGETLEDLRAAVAVTLAADLLAVAAGVLAVLLVHRLSARVRRRAGARGVLLSH